jgi:hypothetical protein
MQPSDFSLEAANFAANGVRRQEVYPVEDSLLE